MNPTPKFPSKKISEVLYDDSIKQRNLVLPKPPKGYDTIPKHLAQAAAHYERMWLQSDEKVASFQRDCFNSLAKGEQLLAHWEISGVQRWILNGFRTIYPTKEILEACINTDVMSTVMGSDIRNSVPSFMLVMPRGSEFTSGVDSEVKASHIIVNLREDEDVVTRFGAGIETIMGMPSKRYLTVSIFWEDLASQSSCIPLEEDDLTLGDIINKYVGNTMHHIQSRMDAMITEEEAKADRETGYAIDVFIANALLIMQSYPEYLTTATHKARGLDTKKMNRKVKVSMFATPSNLRQKVSMTPSEQKDSNGTRAVKTHMRKGHWRRQRHNSEWEVDNPEVAIVLMTDGGHAHMVWIRPVMVEGKDT
jgi:hypothetical protein